MKSTLRKARQLVSGDKSHDKPDSPDEGTTIAQSYNFVSSYHTCTHNFGCIQHTKHPLLFSSYIHRTHLPKHKSSFSLSLPPSLFALSHSVLLITAADSALHNAAYENNTETITLLLKKSPQLINTKDKNGWTGIICYFHTAHSPTPHHTHRTLAPSPSPTPHHTPTT